jgi:hypothetical protein
MPETATADKMICPNCKIPMNHHADKLVPNAAYGGPLDSMADGVIQEFHSCSGCGHAASRYQ